MVKHQTPYTPVIVAALYKFVALPDYRQLREPLLQTCLAHGLKGTLLLAAEGINGTVAGSRAGIDALRAFLGRDGRFGELEYKESSSVDSPFLRMKVKLKKEIVTMGLAAVDPGQRTGTYAGAAAWNRLIDDPEVLVIDTRNRYEFAIGTFVNAISPNIDSFREFPDYVRQHLDPARDKQIAMFCTGGIRCEKASAFLLHQGFAEVHQLKGGILRYLQEVEAGENRWRGECFVFDNRVAVGQTLEQGNYAQCFACRHPISAEDQRSDHYRPGVSCPHCHDRITADQIARFRERKRQIDIAHRRGRRHIGVPAEHQVKLARR